MYAFVTSHVFLLLYQVACYPAGTLSSLLLLYLIEILSFIPSFLSIWPYPSSFYINLCTVDHDNSSCVYRDRKTGIHIPRPVMACRSSWYLRDYNLGSVIGYRAKPDVRSGLFVELLHGDKCYGGRGSPGEYSASPPPPPPPPY